MASQTSTRSCAVYCLGRSPPSSRRRGTVAARRSRPTGSAPCRARSLGATSLIIAACSGAWLARLHRLPIIQRSARSRENLVAPAARRRRHDGAAPSRLGARMAYGLGAVARADARRHVALSRRAPGWCVKRALLGVCLHLELIVPPRMHVHPLFQRRHRAVSHVGTSLPCLGLGFGFGLGLG